MNPKSLAGLIAGAVVIFVLVILGTSATYVVEPGHRGVEVVLGRVSSAFKPEGFGFKPPFITTIVPQAIRQQSAGMVADCYSSDLQQVKIDVRVLYRVPEASVVSIFRDYLGAPFESLVQPRVAEALNEITATRTAEVGSTASWKSDTRPDVSGTSTVTAKTASADGGSCLTVTDVIIVNGEETTVPKKMCRKSGTSGYTLAA